jgi:hypothetical protein
MSALPVFSPRIALYRRLRKATERVCYSILENLPDRS